MQETLIQTDFIEGFLCDEHLAIDATPFESRDASKPSEKKEPAKKNVDANQKKNEMLSLRNKQKSKPISQLMKK